MYKIISRAINARLNTVVNRICSRAQKGFNSQRYTQEVLINVMETIQHCNLNDVSGALIAVDMAKAFDTLSHGFLREVFKFFGLGPNIIKWLTLMGENRLACILLDDGTYSRNFELGRGRAQGDNISPNTFNFADQILIFKLELDQVFTGIVKNYSLSPEIPLHPSPFFMCESRGETNRNESLADDNTTLFLMTEENLLALRNVLNEYGDISGLRCNFNKTVVMPIGKNNASVKNFAGFEVSDSVKLLGLTLNNELDNIDDTYMEIGEKILNLILFWSRFRLSLGGRIAILKTLLIPQINYYLGCFLTPGRDIIDGLQAMLDEFAIGNLTCAVNRRYLPPEKGGLGLIHLGTFLMAQKCSWIKRAHSNTIDNWRLSLKSISPANDISLIRIFDVSKSVNPILYNIVEGFHVFANCFTKLESNFIKSPVFCNPLFVRSKTDGHLLDKAFFGSTFFGNNTAAIRKLTYEDCFNEGIFKSVMEFSNLGLELNNALWMGLRSALLLAKNRYTVQPVLGDIVTTAPPPPDR
jgi:hypothetical protein